MITVDGHAIARRVKKRISKRLAEREEPPVLGVILVGDHAPSRLYVQKKEEAARELNVTFRLWEFDQGIGEDELLAEMKRIQRQPLSGLIVQLPLPDHLNTSQVLNAIHRDIDVDYLSDDAMQSVLDGTGEGEPPTPGAIMEVLRHHKVQLDGAKVVVVGTGRLVGTPIAAMLEHAGAEVKRANRETPDVGALTREADIVVSATGQSGLITGEMIQEGSVVIDAGISVEDGVASGDLDFESVCKKAAIVTPTPGGVGPITVAKLLENTIS
jgi:methylenetetrahydrofolate dehydrogenase (NADP+)/methenyltetrahydrofolate cyclohydrolase